MRVESHRDLQVWQKAIQLVMEVYRASKGFPADERFGLTQQIRRAAVSIPSNIAEGKGRGSTNDFIRFLNIANGSLTEVDTQLVIARELEYIDEETLTRLERQASEVGRMLTGLRRSLNTK
jgi:four helix bundle protein